MSEKVGIIDYGVGNIRSIYNAIKFNASSVEVNLVDKPDKVKDYDKIILPGVGAFEDAIKKVKNVGFDTAIYDAVKEGKMLLGICLGMQLLATKSYEFGEFDGLDLIPGEVLPFRGKIDMRIPHMGWNSVKYKDDRLFADIPNDSDFYFVHSYYFQCNSNEHVVGETVYEINFPSVIRKKNIYGVQFHPEKSQRDGLQIISNFLTI